MKLEWKIATGILLAIGILGLTNLLTYPIREEIAENHIEESLNLFDKKLNPIIRKEKNSITQYINGMGTRTVIRKEIGSPVTNPEQWDTIGNNKKICWINRYTKRKICKNKMQ